jgi:type IV pilus biogenesis protein PilP
MADKKALPADGNKQKIMIVIVIIIVLIIIWQVAGLFTGGSAQPDVTITPTKTMSATSPGNQTPNAAMNAPTAMAPVQTATVTPNQTQPLRVDPALLKLQQETETKYIEAVNQLQLLKIQKDIAEAKEAISKATLDSMTSEHKMSDLLVKPPTPGIADYANSLQNPGQSGRSTVLSTTTTTTVEAAYIVLSVSKQDRRWSAVIGNAGKLYSVKVGETLPIDQSIVVSIDTDGVVLQKDGQQKKIAISSSI